MAEDENLEEDGFEEDYSEFAEELLVNQDGEYEEDVESSNPHTVYVEDAWAEDD